jgi:tetratricopeptide (TPR) repeat protein
MLAREAISVFTALGDRDGEALATNYLGCLHRIRAEYGAGRAALEHSLRLRHAIGDRRAIGLTVGNLGVLIAAEGDPAHGIALLQRALAGFRETEDAPGQVAAGLTMASVHADAGDYEAAQRLLSDALVESGQIPGNHRATAWGYAVLSDVYRRRGPVGEAADALGQARDRFRALGAVDGTAYVHAVTTTATSR